MSENTPSESAIYVATDSFVTVIDGERIVVNRGKTRVREGHPLHKAAPSLFKPLDVHYDVETARQEPVIPPAPRTQPDGGEQKTPDGGEQAKKTTAPPKRR